MRAALMRSLPTSARLFFLLAHSNECSSMRPAGRPTISATIEMMTSEMVLEASCATKSTTSASSSMATFHTTVTRCLVVSESPGSRASHHERVDVVMRDETKAPQNEPSSRAFYAGMVGSRLCLRSRPAAR
jgi:hypothetical protein